MTLLQIAFQGSFTESVDILYVQKDQAFQGDIEMNILIVLPATVRGGCDEYALTIAIGAVRQGHKVTLSFPFLSSEQIIIDKCKQQGVNYHCLKVEEHEVDEFINNPLFQLERGITAITETRPDAVLLVLPWTTNSIGFILACSALAIPTVAVFQLCNKAIQLDPMYLRACVAASKQQLWVTVSQDNRSHLAQTFGLSEKDIIVVPNGTDIQSLYTHIPDTQREELKKDILHELQLYKGTRIALTVGRLTPQKGYLDLLAAIELLPDSLSDLHFLWVGVGEEEHILRENIQAKSLSSRIHLLGFRQDVPQLIVACDLFVFPSRWEGAAFALLEAMAHRAPIVTSNGSSNAELVEHGVHGVVYPAGDANALAGNIVWAFEHLGEMQQMARKAQARCSELYSSSEMVNKTTQLLMHAYCSKENYENE